MNEEQFKKILKEELRNFATKDDFLELKTEFYGLKTEFYGLKTEFYGFKNETRNQFEVVNEKLDELKASSNELDKILEQHPIPRLERLEKHNKLSPFKLKLATAE